MPAALPDGIVLGPDARPRCWWSNSADDYRAYHDSEWGMPVADDRRLFEKICLEGFQSGLSWLTILRKRDAFRAAFSGFDYHLVARYGAADVERLLADKGIVRHRGKIESTIHNARRACALADEHGSLAAFFWRWEPQASARPRRVTRDKLEAISPSPESTALSKDLKKRGWTFVGPTTVYSFMEAMGLVNDHLETCCARAPVEEARRRFPRPKR